MELRLLPLISYLTAVAYIAAWIIHRSWVLEAQIRTWIFQRKAAGRVLSLSALRETNDRFGILLKFLGVGIGIFLASWLVSWISREWLILVLVAAMVLSEEFRPSRKVMNLLAVTVLMDRFHAYTESDSDLFDVLSKTVQELPEGEVQQALREALHRRRSGLAPEECLAMLHGLDPHLDEFILTLKHLNWQTGLALAQAADRLQHRAGRKWDRASHFMLTKDHVWPYLRIVRTAIVAAIIVLSWNGISLHFTAWPSYVTAVWLGLALIGAGLLLYFSLTSSWLRRVLAVLLLMLALSPILNSIGVQSPWWLQIQTVTHISENLTDLRSSVASPASHKQAQSESLILPVSVRPSPGYQNQLFSSCPYGVFAHYKHYCNTNSSFTKVLNCSSQGIMLPSTFSTQVIVWALLLAWLAICVIFDLRSRQVPAFLTVLPLILAAIWQLFQGGWQLVALVTLLILISDLPQSKWRIPVACAATVLGLSIAGSPGVVYAMLVVFAVWALWEIGATGGADAKIIIALVLFFANGLLFIPIVLVGGVQGLVGLIARRKTIPYTVAITLGTVAWLWTMSYQ